MDSPYFDDILDELQALVKHSLDSTYRLRAVLQQLTREHDRRGPWLQQASDDATTARTAGEACLAALARYRRDQARPGDPS